MKLRLFTSLQTILVLFSTALLTLLAVVIFVNVNLGDDVVFGTATGLVAVINDEGIIHASPGLSESDIKNIQLKMRIDERFVEIGGTTYAITAEKRNTPGVPNMIFANFFDSDLSVIKLTPVINFSDSLAKTLIFAVIAFTFFFVISNIFSMHYSTKFIVAPIMRLKQATDRIAEGDLKTALSFENTHTITEISDLYQSVEALRTKLCEAVYYREKYDENRKFLISGISHDLRTPVTAIRGYIEGVLDGVADTPQKKSAYLSAAILKTDTLKNMIDDLLLYSKLDLGQIPFEMQTVNLKEYILELVCSFKSDCERKGVLLELCQCDEGIEGIDIALDPLRFSRVFQNITDNACKSIEHENGRISVNIRKNSSSAIIEIHDNGKGISSENLPHIFARFYRGSTERKNDGSSGLGLTIAKQMTEGMGGRIWATSKQGEGTSIIFSFNIAHRPNQPTQSKYKSDHRKD